MKTIKRACLLCGNRKRRNIGAVRRGTCHLCGGTGIIGSRKVGPQAIGRDLLGREFHELDAFGPIYKRPCVEDYPCTACEGSGLCYRCNGTGVVIAPATPFAIPGGPVSMVKLTLQDPHWQRFLSEHPEVGSIIKMLGLEHARESASRILDTLSDRDLKVLNMFERRHERAGWEYSDFRNLLHRHLPNLAEYEDPLGNLEEYGLVVLAVREDYQGYFVAIKSGQNDEARLIKKILLSLE